MGLCDQRHEPQPDGSSSIKKTNAKPLRLEPHICRQCFGRIGSHEIFLSDSSIAREFICTNCGASAEGRDASVLCCCGIKMRKPGEDGKPGPEVVDAGIRCHENENPRPDFPALIVASYRGSSD